MIKKYRSLTLFIKTKKGPVNYTFTSSFPALNPDRSLTAGGGRENPDSAAGGAGKHTGAWDSRTVIGRQWEQHVEELMPSISLLQPLNV